MLLRGLAFADLGRPQEAASLLARAAEQLPIEQLENQMEVLETQQRIGELVQARITLGRLLAAHPQNARVQTAKAQVDASFADMAAADSNQGVEPRPMERMVAVPGFGPPVLRPVPYVRQGALPWQDVSGALPSSVPR
jgi:hypothetical protein